MQDGVFGNYVDFQQDHPYCLLKINEAAALGQLVVGRSLTIVSTGDHTLYFTGDPTEKYLSCWKSKPGNADASKNATIADVNLVLGGLFKLIQVVPTVR